ncbi:MAG: hypothetical protein R3348_09845, partial [Xanthomonadales bacterium]|nr:hypothetical protein [Xanthomonadales bacterium]
MSSDVLATEDGQWGFGCCCNPAGRVIALLALRPGPDGVVGLCSASLAETLAGWLQRFVFRDDVTIRVRNDLAALGHIGTEASAGGVSGLSYSVQGIEEVNAVQALPGEAFHAAELQRGICWLHPESSAQFLPQMLGFEAIGALSFRKGCYPGQEIIARTRYL